MAAASSHDVAMLKTLMTALTGPRALFALHQLNADGTPGDAVNPSKASEIADSKLVWCSAMLSQVTELIYEPIKRSSEYHDLIK